ncbi:TIGR01212 family radical SAM protein [Candidatus Omnitrophota bacterium]
MYYNSFNNYMKDRFGTKVRKIGLNAHFTCPHIDLDKGRTGCIYCNERGHSDFVGTKLSLKEQIEHVISDGGDDKKYIAYFQNATGTNARVEDLKNAYDVIKTYPEIVGLSISTRPDSVDKDKLDLVASYTDKYEVWMEYGLQTIHDKSLEKIKRGHTFSQTVRAIEMTAERGIKTGVHVILGLPGESAGEMIETAKEISRMPVDGVKMHVLHVLKDTELEKMYKKGEVELLGLDEYVSLACSFIENLDNRIIVMRVCSDAREEVLVAPLWTSDKKKVFTLIDNEFLKRGTRQGDLAV